MKRVEKRRDFLWLNENVILTFVLYLMIIIAGIFGVFYSDSFGPLFKYLLITPSYLNSTSLNWTTGVWVGVLGIHGTIAALSITFMGMFVSQVSSYSEPGFEDICKSLLLRKSHFLIFSLNSVFSLLSGIVLVAFGGGMIAYVISIIVSLCFIFSYGLMYLKLYNVTENPAIINDYLFMELNSAGENHYSFIVNSQGLIRRFNECCEGLSHIDYGWNSNFLLREQRTLNVFNESEQLVLSGFCPLCLRLINDEIKNGTDGGDVKLLLNLSFNLSVSYSSFNIDFENGSVVKDELIYKIEKMLGSAFLTKDTTPDEIVIYRNYEQAVIKNIRTSLLKGSEWGIDFGVKALFALTDKNDFLRTISGLDHSFSYTNKKNSVDYSIFAAFCEKVAFEAIIRNDVKKTSQAMKCIIDIGRFLYTNDYFHEFYILICRSLHEKIRYGFVDGDSSFFDLYVYTVCQNLLYKNYMSFGFNTEFLTKEFRYLQDPDDRESLSAIEIKMVQCVKDVVTLILIRLDYLRDKSLEDDNELVILFEYLRSWVNAEFFNELYYKEGTYDTLFVIPKKTDFDSGRTLREIPDYQASVASASDDTYKSIVSIITQSSFNKNNLNPIFIRDKKDFLEVTGLTTFQLQAISSYLRGEEFTGFLKVINHGDADDSNREAVAEYLDGIILEKNNIVAKFITSSDLDDELVGKYINEVSVSLKRRLDKILDTESLGLSNLVSGSTFNSFINKREVMKPIDGVHYSMNGGYYAERDVFNWIKSVLDKVKLKKKNIIEIETLKELPTEKIVTIHNKLKGEPGVYRYSKGVKMNDEKGFLGLESPGLYYMDFDNEFKFSRGHSLYDVLIEKISDDNVGLVSENGFWGTENPFLYAHLVVAINLDLIEEECYTFYFLSVDNCKKLTALHDHNARLTPDKETILNDSKNIS
ncbi:hypothetical protein [Cedecea neteri]|nr:hypothetical protein [Cedecea neteri]